MCKKWFFSLMFMIAVVSANAQFRKIPAEVTDAFKNKYGNASRVSWKDKLSSFQADFKVGDIQMKSTFSSKGEWIKTESKQSITSIPADVKDGFNKSKYASMPIQDVLKIEEEGKTQYRIIVKKGDFNKRYLVFSNTGQLVSDNTTL